MRRIDRSPARGDAGRIARNLDSAGSRFTDPDIASATHRKALEDLMTSSVSKDHQVR